MGCGLQRLGYAMSWAKSRAEDRVCFVGYGIYTILSMKYMANL